MMKTEIVIDHTGHCADGFDDSSFEVICTDARGRGVKALCGIEKGLTIFNWILKKENIVGVEEYNNSGELGEHSLQVGINQFVLGWKRDGKLVLGYMDLLNHSCHPNIGVRLEKKTGFSEWFALKKIKKGEELTFDYSTQMFNDDWEMKCNCGSNVCRKIVKEFRYLPEDTKQYYINEKALPEWLLEALQL